MEFLDSRHPLADAVQILKSDGRTAVFDGFGHQLLREVVQEVLRPSALAIADGLDSFVGRLGAGALQVATKLFVLFASVIQQPPDQNAPIDVTATFSIPRSTPRTVGCSAGSGSSTSAVVRMWR